MLDNELRPLVLSDPNNTCIIYALSYIKVTGVHKYEEDGVTPWFYAIENATPENHDYILLEYKSGKRGTARFQLLVKDDKFIMASYFVSSDETGSQHCLMSEESEDCLWAKIHQSKKIPTKEQIDLAIESNLRELMFVLR